MLRGGFILNQGKVRYIISTMAEGTIPPFDGDIYKKFASYDNSLEFLSEHVRQLDSKLTDCSEYQRQTAAALHKLQREHSQLVYYTETLEAYCLELDSNSRRKHILLSGIAEETGERKVPFEGGETDENAMDDDRDYEDNSYNPSHDVAYKILSNLTETLNYEDIDTAFRVGRKGNTPRPILVKFTRESVRNDICKMKRNLREFEDFQSIYVNDDLPPKISRQHKDLRSVVNLAKSKQMDAKKIGNKITINDQTYTHRDLGNLPEGIKLADVNSKITPKGLAFSGQHVLFSNFFPIEMRFNGIVFPTAEHAYQFERAKFLNKNESANSILKVRKPQDAKLIGSRLPRSAEWDACKRDKMKEIVTSKFSQSSAMKAALVGTGSINLIEATFDRFWGSGLPLNTKGMIDGRWSGSNVLGQILMELRTELRRETHLGNETNTVNSQPTEPSQQSAGMGTGSPIPNPSQFQSQSRSQPHVQAAQTQSQQGAHTQAEIQAPSHAHVQSQQRAFYKPTGVGPYRSGNHANPISVIRSKNSNSSNVQQMYSNYPPPQLPPNYGQFAHLPPWPVYQTPYPPMYSQSQVAQNQMQSTCLPLHSIPGLPLIQSSPDSDSSGFIQGARHLSYDGTQSPIF